MKANNPFTLTFGRQPGKYIERFEASENIISTFMSENPISQTYLISGIRGSGKTVLMTSIVKELVATGDWISVDLNSAVDLLDDFSKRLGDACKKGSGLSEGGIDISVAGFGVGISGSRVEKDSVSKIESLLEFAKKKNKKVVVTIDEVTANSSMRIFASQFQIFIRKELPVYLIMTGLYENIFAIQNDPKLTFLLRSPKIILEPLSIHQIVSQYKEIFDLDLETATKFAALTKGYAFAFQAFGLLYWEHRDELSFEKIISKFDDLLDDFVYKKIWEGLSAIDKKIVGALVQNNREKVSDVREKLSLTSANFAKYRERLINKGVVSATEHGVIELSLPRFGKVAQTYIEYELLG
ncbi:MAG: AAA family ATPase [Treponema sp.]|nr:AAA family ATPase [Candidatus Treponema equifaecale]